MKAFLQSINGELSPWRKGFTLIELLVVMSIVITLMGILVPAVGRIRRSVGLHGGGNLLFNLANSARQNSLSKNAMTALVMVPDPSNGSECQLFTMLALLPRADSSTSAQSSEWKQISKWESLPSGVVVDKWSGAMPAVAPALPELRYGAQAIGPEQVKFVIFMPDGSTFSDNSTTIQLAEGFMPEGSATPRYTGMVKDGSPVNYFKVTILKSTGRIKIDRPGT